MIESRLPPGNDAQASTETISKPPTVEEWPQGATGKADGLCSRIQCLNLRGHALGSSARSSDLTSGTQSGFAVVSVETISKTPTVEEWPQGATGKADGLCNRIQCLNLRGHSLGSSARSSDLTSGTQSGFEMVSVAAGWFVPARDRSPVRTIRRLQR